MPLNAVLYGHGDLVPVTTTTLFIASLLMSEPSCREASKVLFEGEPLIAECSVEENALVYRIKVKPEPTRSLSSLSITVRGAIQTVTTPDGWRLKRESRGAEKGTELSWSAPKKGPAWRSVIAPIVFVVAVSGPDAGLGCFESYSYERKGSGEGGVNGCPIG